MKLLQTMPRIASVLTSMQIASSAWGGVTLTTLVSFDGINGSKPWGGVVQGADGNFYGTTAHGGATEVGTVFKMNPAGMLTTLYSFSLASGAEVPQAGLTLGKDGHFYGTTLSAPPFSDGTVFKITTDGILTVLFSFDRTNGAQPWNGTLVQGSDGYFYGTTASGGTVTNPPFGAGTVFRVTTNGAFTSLHSFHLSDGATPYGGLVEGTDGNFYGATSGGGTHGAGTVFRITPGGSLTTLFLFNRTNGLDPFSALVRGRDGNFFGTTAQGGASYGDSNSVNRQGFGTIFKMTADGALTTLFSFSGTNGSYPNASLVEGSDGSFYGVTSSGGAYTNQLFPDSGGYAGYGTVFQFRSNGTLTTLVSLDRTNGAQPLGSLMLGNDGNFYGTTIGGGAYDLGTVFRLNIPSPPAVSCPAPATVECGSPVEMTVRVSDPNGEALTVVWNVNGQLVQTNTLPASSQPADASLSSSVDLPLGTNVIAVSVTDSATNTVSCSTTFSVVDTTPPVIVSASANPNVLWPPNHQMVRIRVRADVSDACGGVTWKVVGVQSNEPANDRGDGHRLPDWRITSDHTVLLRAERSGRNKSRIYSIIIQATDATGNLSEPDIVKVTVPKSQRRDD